MINIHLAIALFTIFAAWRWADWKHWRRYHPTMLYITAAGFLYEYLTDDFELWAFHNVLLPNVEIVVIIYAVITMPLSILLYLSRYPTEKWTRQLGYIILWIAIYGVVELLLQLNGGIVYKNGWNFGYSLLFDAIMFPMLVLHLNKPLWAYPISVVIVVLLMFLFKVPIYE
ncbi:CBO0543 family protein [Paenibacillus sp. GCM10027628]|uniref:CBO0543 family protein n=1 Tax=Paenibacillus sp. GCM10027628 TaxID=3273413 RepID=UPI003624BC77